jgi:GT2 family glycosyltransferase
MPFLKDMRLTKYRRKVYARLTQLRNYYISQVDTDYLFSVDSDIMVEPNVLIELLKADKDIIAACINNDKVLRPYAEYPNIRTNILNFDKYDHVVHYMDFPLNSIVEVGCTGAVYLMTKKVTEEVKYENDDQGEDVGFCRNALSLGYKIYAHTGLWQNHVMCEYQNYCIENKCQKPCIFISRKDKVYQYKYIDNTVCPDLSMCGKLESGDKPMLVNYKMM